MQHLVIIGNGIAGITTARHVRKISDMRITIISAETDHFFSRTALMYIYMGHMTYQHTKPYEDHFWQQNRLDLKRGYVTRVDTAEKRVYLDGGEQLSYDKLVLATGSKSNKFGWPGQDLPGVQGLYSRQDVELLEENSKGISRAVIVGGGLIGIELAEMLLSRHIPVTFLVREEFYWDNILPQEDARLISNHVIEHGIDLRTKCNLQAILPGENGRVRAVVTEHGEEIPCQLVGLTPGVHPNTDLAGASGIGVNRGILVNDYLETATADVYACGDCAEIVIENEQRNRIEQLWYTGKMQGMALAQTICGKRTRYQRGSWFNSAKFLDIEYQTYGTVTNLPREGEHRFFWQHDSGKIAVHVVYSAEDEEFIGINSYGIRLRHTRFEQWLREKRDVDYVIANLRTANFDPEFFSRHEESIIEAFNRQTGKSLHPASRPGWFSRILA